MRPRISSLEFSCNKVKPVTYDVPAHAPTAPMNNTAGATDEHDAASTRKAPTPSTAKAKIGPLGSRLWNHSRPTTPNAAPNPSAVISAPNAALPPFSTSVANDGPSGIIAPAPMMPNPRPMITPRTSGWRRMNTNPSLMSRNVSVQSMRVPFGRCLPGIGSRHTIAADTRNVIASNTEREELLIDLERGDEVELAEHGRETGEQGEDDRRDREGAVRRGEGERVGGRELILAHEVRHGGGLRRTPQEREHLQTE